MQAVFQVRSHLVWQQSGYKQKDQWKTLQERGLRDPQRETEAVWGCQEVAK